MPVFSNVVILGNSITYSRQNSSLGWTGNWGMAASAADSDYVHLLTKDLQNVNPACKVNIQNIAAFEEQYDTYSLTDSLGAMQALKPDLLILRIGENVPADFNATDFENKYVALINYFKSANPNLTVFAAGSVWQGKDAVDAIMKKHSAFISLSGLSIDPTQFAYSLYANTAVQQHPDNKGMRSICYYIWQGLIAMVN